MDNSEATERNGHPIGVVARRTGLRPDVLRAWERRYGAVSPFRSRTGRRLYSEEDLRKLRLLRQAVRAGRRISDVASLDVQALSKLVKEDLAAAEGARGVGTEPLPPASAELLRRCSEAVESLDQRGLESSLLEAEASLSKLQVRRRILVPLIETIGDRWAEGSLRIAHEHLASAIIRSFLDQSYNGPSAGADGPAIVVTTPFGQLHELGALLASATAADMGWHVIYLGPNLPADEIASAFTRSGAGAVAISIVYPSRDARTTKELARLRALLGPEPPILAGGRAAPSYGEVLTETGAILCHNLEDLQRHLKDIQA
jgi:DNA-binding transcriptional MerR regulator/methylmalonyl-CoA mutase cobalamin-binding subunit